MPSDTCSFHDRPAYAGDTTAGSATPMIDAMLQPASYKTGTPPRGAAIRTSSRLFVDRVPQPDGSYRTVIRERQ
jgi:hypothetical protein